MKVIGLDLSISCTGFSIIDAETANVKVGTIPIKAKTKKEHCLQTDNDIFDYIIERLDVIIYEEKPDLICIESVFIGLNRRTGMRLNALGSVVRYLLYKSDVPVLDVAPTSLKLYMTGSGKAKKKDMMDEVKDVLGYECSSDNEADAIACGFYGMKELGNCRKQLNDLFSGNIEEI